MAIQTALRSQGFDPGPLDGIWGRATMAAVKEFQKRHGLAVDGVVDDATEGALFAQSAALPDLSRFVWMSEARRLRGVKEVEGPASNPTIIDWAEGAGIDYKGDDVPWCGLFAAHCIGSTLPDEPLPQNPLGARNWARFGVPSEPVWGAVMVFWRGSRDGWQGHVGFYNGEDGTAYSVLGGNQSDSVNTTRIAKARLLEARWPATAAHLRGARVRTSATGALSENEA
ncbi:TIGR02594 family protein [Microbaculum marinum]|uniref:TIGR02594 family protein n=1 Tax=Microbaculum marinum TaxID=1764581 RepID=A0AAW9RRR7_9HYPH